MSSTSLTPPSLPPSAGPGEEPPDVRRPRGGGGAEGADKGADRAQHSAGAGEQPAQDPGQPRADGSVPSAGPDRRLPDRRRPASGPVRKCTSPALRTELRHVSVTAKLNTGELHEDERQGRWEAEDEEEMELRVSPFCERTVTSSKTDCSTVWTGAHFNSTGKQLSFVAHLI